MRLFTIHAELPPSPGPEGWPEPKARAPILLREGFCLAAAVFGALWAAWHRLWLEAALLLALTVAAVLWLPDPVDGFAIMALHVLWGFEARDRQRARLARRGQPLAAVVAAPDAEIAWFRLMRERPDLVRSLP